MQVKDEMERQGFLSLLKCWDRKNLQSPRSPIAHDGRTVQRKSWSHQEPTDSAENTTRELPASSL